MNIYKFRVLACLSNVHLSARALAPSLNGAIDEIIINSIKVSSLRRRLIIIDNDLYRFHGNEQTDQSSKYHLIIHLQTFAVNWDESNSYHQTSFSVFSTLPSAPLENKRNNKLNLTRFSRLQIVLSSSYVITHPSAVASSKTRWALSARRSLQNKLLSVKAIPTRKEAIFKINWNMVQMVFMLRTTTRTAITVTIRPARFSLGALILK